MAVADGVQQMTTLDNAIARVYNYRAANPQFHQFANTGKWFNVRRGIPLKGKSYHYVMYTTPNTGVRRSTFNGGKTSEFPVPLDIDLQPFSILKTDLTNFRGSLKVNSVELKETQEAGENAVFDLARRLIASLDSDFSGQMNASLYQGGSAWVAKVDTMYDTDGTTWSGNAGVAAAFVKIKDGQIGHFQKGNVLDIYDTDGTTQNARVVVLDVIYSKAGPITGGAYPSAEIGPGLIIQACDAYGTIVTDVDWDGDADADYGTSAEPADGDYIARSGEFSTSSPVNIHGFPDWFDPTVNPYRDEDGSAINRDTDGYRYLIPETFQIAAAGSEVAFDIDTHFRDAEDILPQRVATGRMKRGAVDGTSEMGPTLKQSLLALMPTDLLNDAVHDSGDDRRFTLAVAANENSAVNRKMYAEVGFEGFVYHSPTLGPIAFQGDAACPPHVIYMLEPNSFFWVTFAGRRSEIDWIEEGGTRWFPMTGDTNGTLTYYKQAAAFTWACLGCDQPGANVRFTGIKSSNE